MVDSMCCHYLWCCRCMLWRCCKCIASYSSWSHLSLHLLSHSKDVSSITVKQECTIDSHPRDRDKGEIWLDDSCSVCQGSMDSHSIESKYRSCAHCDQVFTEKKILKYHLMIDHCEITRRKSSWFTCPKCPNRAFATSAAIRLHMQEIHFEYLFDVESFAVTSLQDMTSPCAECETLCFLSRYCIRHKDHNKDVSSVQPSSSSVCIEHGRLLPNSHSCQKCEESFENCNDLWSHMLVKHENSNLVCNLCPSNATVNMKYGIVLLRHLKQHHKTKITIREVYNHIRSQTRVTIKNKTWYKCNDNENCSAVVKTFASLMRHLSTHSDQKDFPCEYCGKCFSSNVKLTSHKFIHTKKAKYKCSECERAFTTPSKLNTHVEYKHTLEKRNVCETCGASFIRKRALLVHQYEHENAKYYCHLCTSSFKNPLAVRRHVLVTHAARIMCELCGKEMKGKRILKEHMLSVHSNNRPFVCDICSASFKLKKYLRSHYKIHQKEKA